MARIQQEGGSGFSYLRYVSLIRPIYYRHVLLYYIDPAY
ncbi:hypothetical protein KNP414_00964 [Paenibacillus mucilaginosus KNP414]|uniref:Uncharacterized protein n=1 Tax=Paenibacillus mucilaginosus (strain KNP414) TaxID=1036673 RepID=F8FAA1_PAEMK|nr:hypothetical protein KNP414_00964 [Paenibacillus mucilaginosus KNP414]